MNIVNINLPDPEATHRLGLHVGSLVQDGDVIVLSGDLGAGKTLFSQGVAEQLGVDPVDVTSPTFAIMNIYQGDELEIRHFDLYRLNSAEELADIGFTEYAGGDGVTLIEWGELFVTELPEEYLQVTIYIEGEARRAVLEARGQRYEELLQEVEAGADFSN